MLAELASRGRLRLAHRAENDPRGGISLKKGGLIHTYYISVELNIYICTLQIEHFCTPSFSRLQTMWPKSVRKTANLMSQLLMRLVKK